MSLLCSTDVIELDKLNFFPLYYLIYRKHGEFVSGCKGSFWQPKEFKLMSDIKMSLMFNQYPENDRPGAIDSKFNASVKQIDSMLLCICAVIGSLGNYNVVH